MTRAPQRMTVGALPCLVVHVAGVDVVQPARLRDVARARAASPAASRGDVAHLEVGVERGEVQRHVGAELLARSSRDSALDLGVGVVVAGDQQRRDLEPDVGLVLEVARACRGPAARSAEQSLR